MKYKFETRVKKFKKKLNKLLEDYELAITTIYGENGYNDDYLIIEDKNDDFYSIPLNDIEEK